MTASWLTEFVLANTFGSVVPIVVAMGGDAYTAYRDMVYALYGSRNKPAILIPLIGCDAIYHPRVAPRSVVLLFAKCRPVSWELDSTGPAPITEDLARSAEARS